MISTSERSLSALSRAKRFVCFSVGVLFKLVITALVFYAFFHVSLAVGNSLMHGSYDALLFIVLAVVLGKLFSLYIQADRRARDKRESFEISLEPPAENQKTST